LPVVFPYFSGFRETEIPGEFRYQKDVCVYPEEYYRHIAYQSSFSYRPLGLEHEYVAGGQAIKQEEYLRYYLGEDGLISGSTEYFEGGVAFPDFPAFPLEKLMGFLVQYYQGDIPEGFAEPTGTSSGRFWEWIPAAVIVLFCVADMIKPGILEKLYKRKFSIFGDKRITA
jgi:hypothetical protein